MDCEARQCGTVNIAHAPAGMRHLEARSRQLQALGAGVELLDGETAQRVSGSPVYRYGGILDPTAGTIHPLNYARSLARAARELGAELYQESPLCRLERRRGRWRAVAEGGSIDAEQVILATNAYADAASQGVRESTLPVFIFQCATEPLEPALAAEIIPRREGLWDTQTLMTSSRVDAAGRLVMSSAGSLSSVRARWAYAWSGQIGVTSSRILRVQEAAPGVFAPAGFNGRGIGTGSVLGKHLAALVADGDRAEFPFPLESLAREPWRAARAAWYQYATLALQWIDRRGSGGENRHRAEQKRADRSGQSG